MTVKIIAEMASAHDGELDKAKRLIDAAVAVGADAVKLQYFHNPDRMAERRRVPDYYRDIYRRYSVPLDWLPVLRAHCPIELGCTVFLPEAAALVAPHVDWLKIASFEARDDKLRWAAISTGKRVLVSTGMCDEKSLHRSAYDCVYVLHCVSAYTGLCLRDCNLGAINRYGLDGFSDHVRCECHALTSGYAAVLAGARILEKHLALPDTDPQNPDFPVGLQPDEFAAYVRNVREAEQILGDGIKRQLPCEAEMAQYRVK